MLHLRCICNRFFCRHPWKPTALWGVQLASPLYIAAGLTKLLNLILEGQVRRLALTHKDRLLRFGAELVFAICEAKEVEVIYNWGLAEWQRRYKEGDKVDAYGLKKGIVSYPQFKRKKDNEGSFYIGGDQVLLSDTNRNSKNFRKIPHNGKQKHQYLKQTA